MQDDQQTPQPGTPGVPPAGQQPYDVGQPQPVPAQTVFNPTVAPQPTQPLGPTPDATGSPYGSPQVFTPQQTNIPQTPFQQTPFQPPQPAASWTPPVTNSGFTASSFNPLNLRLRMSPKLLAIIGGGLLLVAIVLGTVKVATGGVTLDDVKTARTTYGKFTSDIYDARRAASTMNNTSTTEGFDVGIKAFETKLADAEKQFTALKDSPIQHDDAVHEKFKAFEAKWTPYVAFLKTNAKDQRTLMPAQIKFEAKLTELSDSAPNNAISLSAYLTSFKKVIDDTSADLKNAKMSLDENQKMVAALRDFLSSASGTVAAAQKDLSGGASTSTVISRLYGINSAGYDLTDKLNDQLDKLNDQAQKLDPADEFNAFGDSLQTLRESLSE